MRKCGWLVLLLGCAPSMVLAAAKDEVALRIEGISGDMKGNLEAYLGKLSPEDLQQWRETLPRLRKQARSAMEAVGYYDSTVRFEPTGNQLKVRVEAGEPVVVEGLSLRYDGEAGNDIAFTALRESLPLHDGEIFHHGRYEALKTLIQNLALERGYFAGKWLRHEVTLHPDTHKAHIELVYDSGPRYHFGSVFFHSSDPAQQELPLDEALLTRLLPFSKGDPYEANKIIELNKALLDSRYFSDVRVRADASYAEATAIPVDVLVSAGKPNQLDLGAGYATDVGPRVSAAWRRPLLNSRGHTIEAHTEISQVRQTIDGRYVVPWSHPLQDTLQLFSGFKREVVDSSTTTYSTTLGIERQTRRRAGWQDNLSLRFNRESYVKDSGERGKSDLLLPGISINRTRSRGGTDPSWGDRQYYQAEAASRSLLSDAELLELRAGWRILRTYADRHQLLLRADAGTLITPDFDSVPLNMRFYAGGDQSVRGYDYQSLSPRDSANIVTGARNLLALSVEYGLRVAPRWRLAAFVDTGNAFNNASEGLKTGVGGGIRWISPVGPIRFDLAWAVSDGKSLPRIHFFMGPAL